MRQPRGRQFIEQPRDGRGVGAVTSGQTPLSLGMATPVAAATRLPGDASTSRDPLHKRSNVVTSALATVPESSATS